MMRGALHRRVYAIGGDPAIAVYGDCGAALDSLELRSMPDGEASSVSGAVELFLLGRVRSRRLTIDFPRDAKPVYSGHGIIETERGGVRYADWFGKAKSALNPARDRAVVLFPGIRYFNRDFTARAVLRPLVDRMLAAKGWFPVHAAAAGGGTGIILAGGAGMGKSTLLYGLVSAGMGFFGDDRVYFRRTTVGFEIGAFPEFIRLPPDDILPKLRLSPPKSPAERIEAGMIVFLQPDEKGVPLERIGAAEAAARLLAAVPPFALAGEPEFLSDTAARFAAKVDAWVLRGWGKSGERLALVLGLLRGEGRR
jgi:hypothetical protein